MVLNCSDLFDKIEFRNSKVLIILPAGILNSLMKEEASTPEPAAPVEIPGQVFYANGSPANGITMEVSVEGIRFNDTLTDQEGRYKFIFPGYWRSRFDVEISDPHTEEGSSGYYRSDDIWGGSPTYTGPMTLSLNMAFKPVSYAAEVKADTEYFSSSVKKTIDPNTRFEDIILYEKSVEFAIVASKAGINKNSPAAKVLLYPNGINLSGASAKIAYNSSIASSKIIPGNCTTDWVISEESHSFTGTSGISGNISACTLFEIETTALTKQNNISITLQDASAYSRTAPPDEPWGISYFTWLSKEGNYFPTSIKNESMEIDIAADRFTAYKPATVQNPTMSISDKMPVYSKDNLVVDIYLLPGENIIDGVQSTLDYDKSLLELKKASPGNCNIATSLFSKGYFAGISLQKSQETPCLLFEVKMEALKNGMAEIAISDFKAAKDGNPQKNTKAYVKIIRN